MKSTFQPWQEGNKLSLELHANPGFGEPLIPLQTEHSSPLFLNHTKLRVKILKIMWFTVFYCLEWLVHFSPGSVVQFNPESVAHSNRNWWLILTGICNMNCIYFLEKPKELWNDFMTNNRYRANALLRCLKDAMIYWEIHVQIKNQ